jgi:hypothetical protein
MKRYKVNSKTNCYEWLEDTVTDSYPQIKFGGKVYDAYLLIAALFVRTLTVGDRVTHSCDNKRCINPEHLNVVPLEENIVYCWDGIKPEDDKQGEDSHREQKSSPEWASTQLDLVEKLSKAYNLSKRGVVELALNNLNDMTDVLESLTTK